MNCVLCGGVLVFLGSLGSLDHFRCEGCGIDQSQEQEKEEENVEV